MGFLKSVVSAVTSPFNSSTYTSMFKDFSGRSQQDDANAMAMKAWNLANDYNSPKAQVERLVAAGLNPYLVNLAGNTAGTPALTGGNVSTGTQSLFSGLNDIIGAVQGQANIRNTYAQTSASQAAAGASAAQANYTNAQMEGQETKNKFLEKTMIADLDYKKAQTRLAEQTARKTSAEADIAQGEATIFGGAGGSKGVKTFTDIFKGGARLVRGFFH